jgi:hypothetical protein
MLSKQKVSQDPAAGAANLVLRIGVLVLVIGAPCAAVVSRRLLFVLMPVGAVLMLIGALLLPAASERIRRHLAVGVGSPIVLAAVFLMMWTGLSLLWTPYLDPAFERYFKTAGTALLVIVGISALPDHIRASNSNLVAIGTAAAALAIVFVAIFAPHITRATDPDGTTLQRATIGVVVLLWPALSAVILRDRIASAGSIAIVVSVAVVMVWTPMALGALIIGMMTFSFAYSKPLLTGRVLGGLVAALIVLAPAIPLALAPFLPNRIDPNGIAALINDWGTVVRGEGVRLVTGHGFDAAIRALVAGILPPRTPRGLLFDVWYELGVTGAVAMAVMLWFAFQSAARLGRVIAPFMLAALASASAIAISGLAGAQLWWMTLLAVVALAFAIVVRGQFRTERVHASVVGQQRPTI